jgi:hypothetical protein
LVLAQKLFSSGPSHWGALKMPTRLFQGQTLFVRGLILGNSQKD